MISDVLSVVTEKLNEFLNSYYDLPETLAVLGTPGGEEAEDGMNRILVSLLNVEREGAAGFAGGYGAAESGHVGKRAPAWHVNLCFVVSAVFEDKRYHDGLTMLSAAVNFLQGQSVFMVGGRKFTIELMALSIQELTNVWSILGGRYHPSVVCKIRMLTFDNNEARGTLPRVKKTE